MARAHAAHHDAGDQAVDGQLDHHRRQDAHRGHAAQCARERGAGQTAQQAELPAAHEAAQKDGDVHRAEDLAGALNAVKQQRQHIAQGDAHGGDDGFVDGRHGLHRTSVPF